MQIRSCSKHQQLQIALYSVSERSGLNWVAFEMDLFVHIQLIFLCVVNIVFTFPGIISNTLVIASYWKSSQLRKKLCHFMIMVLSCFDLVAVVTNHPGALLYLISWLREDYDLLPTWRMYLYFANVFLAFSFYVLLVTSVERYLGAYYPIFHRISVTKRRLLTLLAILLIFQITLNTIYINDIIISRSVGSIIFFIVVFLPLAYLNLKLFKISKKVRRRNVTSDEKGTRINLKSISTCVLVVACLLLLSIPTSIYIVFHINTENKQASNVRLSLIWGRTIYTMNCTFNSLIFFWRNKVLRTEGIKVLKTWKNRLVGS